MARRTLSMGAAARLPARLPARLIVAMLMATGMVAPRIAWADRVGALTTSLLGDSSWRVKVQAAITLGKLKAREPRAVLALVEALRDENEAVRAVAAETLGRLGDLSAVDALRMASEDSSPGVRAQAKRAIESIDREFGRGSGRSDKAAGAASADMKSGAGPRWFVELADIAPGGADVESAHKVRDRAVRELGQISGVTLDPRVGAPRSRYFIDGNLTKVGAGAADTTGRVHTDCAVRMVLGTLPERAIQMMASLSSSVEGTADAKDLDSARADCLTDLGKQIAEKAESYLQSHR